MRPKPIPILKTDPETHNAARSRFLPSSFLGGGKGVYFLPDFLMPWAPVFWRGSVSC